MADVDITINGKDGVAGGGASKVILLEKNGDDETTANKSKKATQTTLDFTERLKAFYQAKAEEKATCNSKTKDCRDG
eukprot:13828061-Ditylum_brightwellii.AAC.1